MAFRRPTRRQNDGVTAEPACVPIARRRVFLCRLFDAARISEAVDLCDDKHGDQEEHGRQAHGNADSEEGIHVALPVAPISGEHRRAVEKSKEFCATSATGFEGLNRS